jgi:hypothetical protein
MTNVLSKMRILNFVEDGEIWTVKQEKGNKA